MTMMARTPLWREIETTLRKEIGAGRYRAGARLPTEATLSGRFGVNRHTVRRALAAMQADGLVFSRRGAGVFVASEPTIYPLGRRVRFHQSLEAAGRTPLKEILRLETVAAGEREAAALDLAPGAPVHIWEGVAFSDDSPICVFHSVFPAERLPKLKDSLAETRSVTTALALEGVSDYTRKSTDLTAERAGSMLALRLRLSDGAPLLRAVAINVDAEGAPIEYGRSWFAGESVTLSVENA
ncbi:MAG: phosphonate metabolism transcriptional regulator PhnF [Pseudomonadota bacterium]